jgi:hypothetical protein
MPCSPLTGTPPTRRELSLHRHYAVEAASDSKIFAAPARLPFIKVNAAEDR